MDGRIRSYLSKDRYRHTIGVVKAARQLAKEYAVSIDKAKIAGLLHDCAKMLDYQQLIKKAEEYRLDLDDISRLQPGLLHGVIGSIMARWDFGIEDAEILDAIRYHTTGRAGMTPLEKIIYLADYIEEGRDFPGVDRLRDMSKRNLDQALLLALNHSIQYIIEKRQLIHPNTIEARNDILRMIYYNKCIEGGI
jgi:predicted HD superfamily hydrolase involved in NAD metabolism